MTLSPTRPFRRVLAAPLLILLAQSTALVAPVCTDMGTVAEAGVVESGHHQTRPSDEAPSSHLHRASQQGHDTDTAFSVGHHGDGHDSGPPPCTMVGHCVAGLPGLGVPSVDWIPPAGGLSAYTPGWQLHSSISQHLTPPPRA